MRTLKLTIAYDGTNYVGWQRQANGVSIQQLVEEAFGPLVGSSPRGPTVAGASRTDAGVHALGQVASIYLESNVSASAIGRALNMRLPDDIRVVGVVDSAPGFHARYHATGKRYRYRLTTTPVQSPFDRWFVWHTQEPCDVDAMRVAAAALVGRHDFASFQAKRSFVRETVRTITRCEVQAVNGEIVVEVDGGGFLRHMVRILVGTLVDVGAGNRRPDSMPEVLAACDRRAAGPTAPAAGLTLVAVHYPPLC